MLMRMGKGLGRANGDALIGLERARRWFWMGSERAATVHI